MLKLLIKRIKLYKLYKEYSKFGKKYGYEKSNSKYMELIHKMEKEIECDELKYFYDQTLFIYCPNCKKELLSQHTKIDRNGNLKLFWRSLDTIICTNCNHESKWVNGVSMLPKLVESEEELNNYIK